MATKTSFKAMIPLGADLPTLFPDPRDLSKAQAILQHIFFMRIQLKKDDQEYGFDKDEGWCPVGSKNLRKLARGYERILRVLIANGIVEEYLNALGNASYEVGKSTKLLRVKFKGVKATSKQKFEVQRITHPERVAAINRYYLEKYENKKTDLLSDLPWFAKSIEFIESLWIDVSDDELRKKHPKKADYLIGAKNGFNEGINRYIKRDTYGKRVNSHLSNLSKILRPYLRVRGELEPLILLDVRNSQVAFLAMCFRYPDVMLPLVPEFLPLINDIKKFSESDKISSFYNDSVRFGQVYKVFGKAAGLDRDTAKDLMISDILFCKPKIYEDSDAMDKRKELRKAFRIPYSEVFALLQKLKNTKKQTLRFMGDLRNRKGKKPAMFNTVQILATRAESVCLLEHVVRNARHIGLATIHDGFLLRSSDAKEFTELYKETFLSGLGVDHPQLEEAKPKKRTT